MFALFVLSLGLAMDAFAVSLVRGSTGEKRLVRAAELGLAFGLAQGLMPLLGWALGLAFGNRFESFDHWIAFVLLGVLGGRMLVEAASSDGGPAPGGHTRLLGLATAAFATSVDAAAAGLTLPLLGVMIPAACLTIGATTALLCTIGYALGSRVAGRLGKRAELLGGLVLIGLGIKILVEHLSR
ncbi:MAG TPA: manganese efflux pump MntP family protein [Allosphingosinicella sp.]